MTSATSTWGNSWLSTWATSWNRSVSSGTTGGFDESQIKKYRKHLERLAKISDERLYPKQAKPIVEELENLPVEIEEIKKLAESPQTTGTLRLTPEIDYNLLTQEIETLRAYLDRMEQDRLRLMEADDEIAFLLLIN